MLLKMFVLIIDYIRAFISRTLSGNPSGKPFPWYVGASWSPQMCSEHHEHPGASWSLYSILEHHGAKETNNMTKM